MLKNISSNKVSKLLCFIFIVNVCLCLCSAKQASHDQDYHPLRRERSDKGENQSNGGQREKPELAGISTCTKTSMQLMLQTDQKNQRTTKSYNVGNVPLQPLVAYFLA